MTPAAIRSHIERVLSPSRVETLAAQMIRERLQLVKASEAARLLHMDSDEFRKLRLPVVTLGPKSHRYRARFASGLFAFGNTCRNGIAELPITEHSSARFAAAPGCRLSRTATPHDQPSRGLIIYNQ